MLSSSIFSLAPETMSSAKQFEYQVCAMQNNRITFVNGDWQGEVAPTAEDPNEALASCPTAWDYLGEAGRAGWELVTAIDQQTQDTHMQTLFLKREVLASI